MLTDSSLVLSGDGDGGGGGGSANCPNCKKAYGTGPARKELGPWYDAGGGGGGVIELF